MRRFFWCTLALAWVVLAFVPVIPWYKGSTLAGYWPLYVAYLGATSAGRAAQWAGAHLMSAALLALVLTWLRRRGGRSSSVGNSPVCDVLVALLAIAVTLVCGVGAAVMAIFMVAGVHGSSLGSLGIPLVFAVWGCACGVGLLRECRWARRWILLWALGSALALAVASARGALS